MIKIVYIQRSLQLNKELFYKKKKKTPSIMQINILTNLELKQKKKKKGIRKQYMQIQYPCIKSNLKSINKIKGLKRA